MASTLSSYATSYTMTGCLGGLSDRKLQKRLLSEDELTLKTAERIIKSSEIAVNQADAINEDPNINSVKYRLGRRGEYSAQKIEYRGRERSRGRAYRGFYDRYDRSRSRSGPSAGQRSSKIDENLDFGSVWHVDSEYGIISTPLKKPIDRSYGCSR